MNAGEPFVVLPPILEVINAWGPPASGNKYPYYQFTHSLSGHEMLRAFSFHESHRHLGGLT